MVTDGSGDRRSAGDRRDGGAGDTPRGLHAWSTARFASVRPVVTVADGTGRVEPHAEIERAADEPSTVRAAVAGVTAEVAVPAGERTAVVTLTVAERALWFFAEDRDARWPAAQVDRALVTLLPGESATFTVHAPGPLDADALTRRPVLRCVNDLV
ncbi:hypothetical protein GA0070215_112120 [Micromonospora marina]|uniref:Beta-mannosidase n=1 Tax=Micromonospora marina TaxID=307120 RepID=A0A1C4YSB6_9ACTN|nr:hypothetical protein GA0070215_112120 [Micromonospora marina]